MSTTDSVNHSPAFKISTAGTDPFSIQDQINLAADLDGQDHSSGKGLPVKRVKSGTHATMPVAGTAGNVWVDTDSPLFRHDNAIELVGHVVPIESQTISVAAASVTFQAASYGTGALPTVFRHLMGECYVRTAGVFFGQTISLRFNADSGANYDYNYYHQTSSATIIDRYSQNFIQIGYAPALNGAANRYSHITFKIPYYQSSGHKVLTSQGYSPFNSGGSTVDMTVGGGVWKSTAAITSITLFADDGGNIDVGSIFTLYGLP